MGLWELQHSQSISDYLCFSCCSWTACFKRCKKHICWNPGSVSEPSLPWQTQWGTARQSHSRDGSGQRNLQLCGVFSNHHFWIGQNTSSCRVWQSGSGENMVLYFSPSSRSGFYCNGLSRGASETGICVSSTPWPTPTLWGKNNDIWGGSSLLSGTTGLQVLLQWWLVENVTLIHLMQSADRGY